MAAMTSRARAIPKLQCNVRNVPPSPTGNPLSPVGSPKTWCQSMDELSRSLQKICGSPSPGGSTELLHSSPSPPRTSPVPKGFTSPSVKAPVSNNGLAKSWGRGLQRAISHEQSLQGGGYLRPVMVRHEETEAKLEQMLSQICATQKEYEKTRNNSPGQEVKEVPGSQKRRDSLKSGLKLRLELEEMVLMEELTVSVDDDNNLQVCLLDRAGRVREMLHSVPIPHTTVLENVICSKTRGSLYIRECSVQHLSLYFCGIAKKYLPIILEDFDANRVKIVFHVPKEISFDNLAVKTVDESVVVLGQRGRSPTLSEGEAPYGNSSSDQPEPKSEATKQCFRLRIELPDGVDTRTVSAALSRANQLIMCGAMDDASRRYTC